MGTERTTPITMAKARALPGMLGRICPAMLAAHSRYGVVADGQRMMYVLVSDETSDACERSER